VTKGGGLGDYEKMSVPKGRERRGGKLLIVIGRGFSQSNGRNCLRGSQKDSCGEDKRIVKCEKGERELTPDSFLLHRSVKKQNKKKGTCRAQGKKTSSKKRVEIFQR